MFGRIIMIGVPLNNVYVSLNSCLLLIECSVCCRGEMQEKTEIEDNC